MLPTSALFVFIGATPQTDWLDGLVERDAHGYIISGLDLLQDGHRPAGWTLERDPFLLETGVPGVFVAGDTRLHSMKRVASAVGEGAMSVRLVHDYMGVAGFYSATLSNYLQIISHLYQFANN